MAFAVCINASALNMETKTEGFNTIYTYIMGSVLLFWPLVVTVRFSKALKNMPSISVLLKKEKPATTISELNEGGQEEQNVVADQNKEKETEDESIFDMQDEFQRELGQKFGTTIAQLAPIRILGKQSAVFFVLIFFLRRALTPIIVLALNPYPVGQIILVLALNMLYLMFILSKPVFSTR